MAGVRRRNKQLTEALEQLAEAHVPLEGQPPLPADDDGDKAKDARDARTRQSLPLPSPCAHPTPTPEPPLPCARPRCAGAGE